MGLDALLTVKDSVTFARRVGTTMFLLPEGEKYYYENMKAYVFPSLASAPKTMTFFTVSWPFSFRRLGFWPFGFSGNTRFGFSATRLVFDFWLDSSSIRSFRVH